MWQILYGNLEFVFDSFFILFPLQPYLQFLDQRSLHFCKEFYHVECKYTYDVSIIFFRVSCVTLNADSFEDIGNRDKKSLV